MHVWITSGAAGVTVAICIRMGMCNFVRYYAPINVSSHPPTRDRVGNFPCLEWQACPRGGDIESLKCACETHAARVPSRFEFERCPVGGAIEF